MADKALRLQELEAKYTGACNAMEGQHYIVLDNSSFSYEDIDVLLDNYYNGEGERHIHMSDVNGRICWKSMGGVANHKLANQLKKNCYSTLQGEGSREKCDALYEVVDKYSEAPQSYFQKFFNKHPNVRETWNTIKWPLGAILGGWGFHVGWDIHKKMKGKDPDDPNNKPPLIPPAPPASNPGTSVSPAAATPPESTSHMSALPPPPKEAWYTLAVTTILTTGAMLALKAREAAAVAATVASTVRDIGSAINSVKVAPLFMFEFQIDLIEQGNPYMNPGSHPGPG